MKIPVFRYSIIRGALWKSLVATLFFAAFYFLYSVEFIRENVEDLAFDTVNKFSIYNQPAATDSAQVFLFAIDDLYMREHRLFDEDNRSNYGYLFPRDQIAGFIEEVDALVSELDKEQYPKALFIDYDMSFTMLPYGKELSKEDQKLLEVLKRPRPYKILLAKTEQANFIESSPDKAIRQMINDGRLMFVSVPLLKSSDDTVRRYQSFQSFGEMHPGRLYPSVTTALWQLMRENRIDIDTIKERFAEKDIIANRIFLKAYDPGIIDEENCLVQYSHWQQLRKYSANCSLFEIDYDDFGGSVLMLGGTHSDNNDKFTVLSILRAKTFSGIDIHANALMTTLTLNGSLKRLAFWPSILLVFVSFFLLDALVAWLLQRFRIDNEKVEFIVLLTLSTFLLYSLSVYLLRVHHLWFNWFVPLVLFQMLEVLLMVRQQGEYVFVKMIRRIRR